jgi:hypothetical protein
MPLPFNALLKSVGLGGSMAREPRLAEVFDKNEDSTANAQEIVASAADREEDEDLSEQYYRTPLCDPKFVDRIFTSTLRSHRTHFSPNATPSTL